MQRKKKLGVKELITIISDSAQSILDDKEKPILLPYQKQRIEKNEEVKRVLDENINRPHFQLDLQKIITAAKELTNSSEISRLNNLKRLGVVINQITPKIENLERVKNEKMGIYIKTPRQINTGSFGARASVSEHRKSLRSDYKNTEGRYADLNPYLEMLINIKESFDSLEKILDPNKLDTNPYDHQPKKTSMKR